MSVCEDGEGSFYLNNVRVNGIIPARPVDFWYLLGVLNSRVIDWVFRRIAKPKDGGYFEANRQFIAPLPIPAAKKDDATAVETVAKELTKLHTRRRDEIAALSHRLESCEEQEKAVEWLWPKSVSSLESLIAKAPDGLTKTAAKRYAKEEQAEQIAKAQAFLADSIPAFRSFNAERLFGTPRARASSPVGWGSGADYDHRRPTALTRINGERRVYP